MTYSKLTFDLGNPVRYNKSLLPEKNIVRWEKRISISSYPSFSLLCFLPPLIKNRTSAEEEAADEREAEEEVDIKVAATWFTSYLFPLWFLEERKRGHRHVVLFSLFSWWTSVKRTKCSKNTSGQVGERSSSYPILGGWVWLLLLFVLFFSVRTRSYWSGSGERTSSSLSSNIYMRKNQVSMETEWSGNKRRKKKRIEQKKCLIFLLQSHPQNLRLCLFCSVLLVV